MNAPAPHAERAALLQRAGELLARDETAAAEEILRALLRPHPDDPHALTLLGIVLQASRRFAESESVFQKLTELQPGEPAHWVNLGSAQRGLEHFDAALASGARAAALGAGGADFDFNLALTHVDRGDLESARHLFERALRARPDDAEIRVQYAQVCHDTLHTDEAAEALEGWQSFEGAPPTLLAQVAQLLTNLGDQRQAEVALSQLLSQPLPAEAALTVVQILERTNRVADARQLLDRALADPTLDAVAPERLTTEAQLLQREGKHEPAVRLFTRALPGAEKFPRRHFQLFPLARSLDALGRHADAFRVLTEAHASQEQYLLAASPALALRGTPTMAVTRIGCTAEDFAQWDDAGAPDAAASPVFVVAFPRSGTTLLELALDAHPELKSMDEQPFVQNALDDLNAAGANYPEGLARLTRAQLAQVRTNYWKRVARKVSLQPGERLVDKNPLNILRLGVIRRLFPAAPVLLAIRHPCDVLLSCFMQHFRAPDFALLCRDLPTLANGFRRAFDYWYAQADILSPRVREVRYETFVGDFESEMRAIAGFLELRWDDAMLRPADRARAKGFVSTPSYAQVAEPVHRRSVGRWEPYAEHFGDALPPLAPYLQRWDYAGGPANSR